MQNPKSRYFKPFEFFDQTTFTTRIATVIPRTLAITQLRKAFDLDPNNQKRLQHWRTAVSGRRVEAHKVLDELIARSRRRQVPAYTVATICAALGDKDQAFVWLERAYTQRSWYLISLKVDPKVDSLRSDPCFADLVRRVGLPQ